MAVAFTGEPPAAQGSRQVSASPREPAACSAGLILAPPQIVAQRLAQPLIARRPLGLLCAGSEPDHFSCGDATKTGAAVKRRVRERRAPRSGAGSGLDPQIHVIRQDHRHRPLGGVFGGLLGMDMAPGGDAGAIAFDRGAALRPRRGERPERRVAGRCLSPSRASLNSRPYVACPRSNAALPDPIASERLGPSGVPPAASPCLCRRAAVYLLRLRAKRVSPPTLP